MRVLIVGILVLTLGVAGVATYLIGVFSTPDKIEELEKQAAVKVFRVLIASREMKIGTVVNNEMLQWQAWPEKDINPLFITVDSDEKQAEEQKKRVGMTVRQPIVPGEPITDKKLFKRDKPGFMSGMLNPGMRAMPIAVNQITGVAGFIFPGDYVDVVLTHTKLKDAINKRIPKEKDKELPLTVLATATETVLQKVRVLAIGQKVDQFDPKVQATVVPTVTLEVDAKQAQILTTANAMGRLSLVLRSLEDASKPDEPRSFTTDVEVSPFMSHFDEIINKMLPPPGPTPEEIERQRLAKEVDRLQSQLNVTQSRLSSTEETAADLEARLQSEQKRAEESQKEYEDRLKAEAERRAAASKAQSKPAPAPKVEKKPAKINIYRANSRKTQEVEFK